MSSRLLLTMHSEEKRARFHMLTTFAEVEKCYFFAHRSTESQTVNVLQFCKRSFRMYTCERIYAFIYSCVPSSTAHLRPRKYTFYCKRKYLNFAKRN